MASNIDAGADTFARPRIVAEPQPDGAVLLRSATPLGPHAEHLGQELRRWAGREGLPSVLSAIRLITAETVHDFASAAGSVESRYVQRILN